jgi:hypothetical protein
VVTPQTPSLISFQNHAVLVSKSTLIDALIPSFSTSARDVSTKIILKPMAKIGVAEVTDDKVICFGLGEGIKFEINTPHPKPFPL